MRKPTITRTWITGLIVFVAGLIIGGISLGLMFAYGGTFGPSISGQGQDFYPSLDATFWTAVTFASLGFLITLIGGVIQIVAWIGSLINTYQLQDKTWFAVMLAGGLIGLAFSLVGLAVMIVYVIAGPDGMAERVERPPEAPFQQPPQTPTQQPPYASAG